MKAYKILLKQIIQTDPFTGKELKDEKGNPIEFSYRQQLWSLLRSSSSNEGISTDDLMKRAQVQFLLEQTKEGGSVLLEKAQYDVLKETIDKAKWIAVTKTTADMIDSVKNAAEVDVDEAKSDKSAKN